MYGWCDGAHYWCWALVGVVPCGRFKARLSWIKLHRCDAARLFRTLPSRWARSKSSHGCGSMWQLWSMPRRGGKSLVPLIQVHVAALEPDSSGRYMWLHEWVHVVLNDRALDTINLTGVDSF
jgi:hypothetical protein